MPLFIDAHNYVSCHRCHCIFIPIDVSPTTATARCPSCNTTSRLPHARQPPPPPPQPPSTPSSPLSSLTEDDDYLDSSFEEDDDFVTDVNWPAEADDYEPNPTPAANSFINSLKTLKRAVTFEVLKQLDEACVICLDEFILEEIVNEMPCGHWFHSDCIIRWLSLNNTCPLCRYEIPKEPYQDIILRSFWIVGLQQRQWLQNSSVREPDRNILLHSRILENSSSYARPREDLT